MPKRFSKAISSLTFRYDNLLPISQASDSNWALSCIVSVPCLLRTIQPFTVFKDAVFLVCSVSCSSLNIKILKLIQQASKMTYLHFLTIYRKPVQPHLKYKRVDIIQKNIYFLQFWRVYGNIPLHTVIHLCLNKAVWINNSFKRNYLSIECISQRSFYYWDR